MTARTLSIGLALAAAALTGCRREPKVVTFHEHIAPIVANSCATCHQPGEAAPFSLLTFEDVKKRASQVAEVTSKRYMPPWLPERGQVQFDGDRSLTDEQIRLIQRWVDGGAPEGQAPRRKPAAPRPTDGWHLGRPDLVVTMPEPYELPASGPDVYRNFVIPVPLATNRIVRAIEIKPGSKGVHHAFVQVDQTREARRLDDKEPGVGFGGMHTPPSAQVPDGFFLTWQPGKLPSPNKRGLTWTLQKNSDLVMQVHMQPTGKPEPVQCSIAFYFADRPSPLMPMTIGIRALDINIPAGAADYVVERSYLLPVDVELLGLLPHAHYLAREMHALAALPDGVEKQLLTIKQWDFNWQGDYQFKEPLRLAKGTRVVMKYIYDNSTNNVRNPNQPPQKVGYGVNSTDEMAELWLQVLVGNAQDQRTLAADLQKILLNESLQYNQYLLTHNPRDARAHTELGKSLMMLGRTEEAEAFLKQALVLEPTRDDAHYYLGIIFRMQGRLAAAREAFAAAVSANPENGKAHGNLGLVLIQMGNPLPGRRHLEAALRLNPDDTVARDTLAELDNALKNVP